MHVHAVTSVSFIIRYMISNLIFIVPSFEIRAEMFISIIFSYLNSLDEYRLIV